MNGSNILSSFFILIQNWTSLVTLLSYISLTILHLIHLICRIIMLVEAVCSGFFMSVYIGKLTYMCRSIWGIRLNNVCLLFRFFQLFLIRCLYNSALLWCLQVMYTSTIHWILSLMFWSHCILPFNHQVLWKIWGNYKDFVDEVTIFSRFTVKDIPPALKEYITCKYVFQFLI